MLLVYPLWENSNPPKKAGTVKASGPCLRSELWEAASWSEEVEPFDNNMNVRFWIRQTHVGEQMHADIFLEIWVTSKKKITIKI